MSETGDEPIYRVIFLNQSLVYELYAKEVFESDLFGFIEVGELIFTKPSSLIVDPGEDRLRAEFNGVKRFFILSQSIVRIDEVEQEGIAKMREAHQDQGTNVRFFPGFTKPLDKAVEKK